MRWTLLILLVFSGCGQSEPRPMVTVDPQEMGVSGAAKTGTDSGGDYLDESISKLPALWDAYKSDESDIRLWQHLNELRDDMDHQLKDATWHEVMVEYHRSEYLQVKHGLPEPLYRDRPKRDDVKRVLPGMRVCKLAHLLSHRPTHAPSTGDLHWKLEHSTDGVRVSLTPDNKRVESVSIEPY